MKQQRMTAAQFQAVMQKSSGSKMGNRKTEVDGILFDSQMEANRYCELKYLLQAGEIQGFERQPSFIIDISGTRYRPDFIVCGKDGCIWVEDVKGHETPKFKRDKRLWEIKYPWLPLKIIK